MLLNTFYICMHLFLVAKWTSEWTSSCKHGQLLFFVLYILKPWGFKLCKTFPKPRKVIFVLNDVTAVWEQRGWARGMMGLKLLHIFSGPHTSTRRLETSLAYVPGEQLVLDWTGAIFGPGIQFGPEVRVSQRLLFKLDPPFFNPSPVSPTFLQALFFLYFCK